MGRVRGRGDRLVSYESLLRQPNQYAEYERLKAYFQGRARLDALGVSLPPQVRVLELVVDWPRITVEALEDRLTVEGFTLAGSSDTIDRYWRWWQANRMDQIAPMIHTEALAQGLAWALVGKGPGDVPRITAHSRKHVRANINKATGDVEEALLTFHRGGEWWRAHYTPGTTTYYGRTGLGTWALADPDGKGKPVRDSGLGSVPLVPYVNRASIENRLGESEMTDTIRYTDAASRTITNLQVGQELVGMPTKYAVGVKPDDFKGSDGTAKTAYEAYLGHMLTAANTAAKFGILQGGDLTQLHSTVKLYAQLVSGATGLSLNSLGITSDANPTSGDAVNALERRHVKRAEKKQIIFGESHESVMRLCDELVSGTSAPEAWEVETNWRPAATPTLQSVSQAAVQLVQAGIIPPAVARDMVGLTEQQKRIAKQYDALDPQRAFARTLGTPTLEEAGIEAGEGE